MVINVPELAHPDKLDCSGTELDEWLEKEVFQLQPEHKPICIATGYCEYKITKIFLPLQLQDVRPLKWNIHISSHRGVIEVTVP